MKAYLAALPLGMACVILLCGCEREAPVKTTKSPRVVVTTPITATVMDYQDFTGRLQAVKSIEIRARVSGYVSEVFFQEGDLIKEGDPLFQIDRRPYQADLNLADANMKVAITDRELQAKNAVRAEKLFKANSISREEYDAVMAASAKASATVGAMEAAKAKAKLYLDYTRVDAPVSGRISRRYVDPGNLITADNTILTTLVSEDPIHAYFDVDERTYLEMLESTAGNGGLKTPILMRLANEEEFTRVGRVDFIDNRVAATTGTVPMRGVFANPKGLLKPGLFMRVRLPIGAANSAILIPDEAIQSDQDRKYVWIVNKKNEVEYRPVKLGQALKELRVIRPPDKGKEGKEGLSEGERVIIGGVQRVRQGTHVDVQVQPPPAPPESPLVRLLNKR